MSWSRLKASKSGRHTSYVQWPAAARWGANRANSNLLPSGIESF